MGCNVSRAVDVSNTIASVPKGTQTGVSLISLKAVLQSQTDSESPQQSIERHTDSVPNSTGDSQSNVSIKDDDTTTSEVSPDIHDASSVGDISANREEEDNNNNKENYQQEDVIPVFTEFPEPTLLQNANEIATRNNQSIRVDDEGNTPPYPCPTWKKEVFNANEFAELDAFAVEAPEEKCLGTMADLVDYLTHPPSHVPQSAGSGEMSDVSKARVLFRWITAQDLNSLNATADASLDSPLGHLRNIKEEKGVYSALYVAMCRVAGLMCTELRGCVKGVNYQPGDEIDPTKTSAWTAVLVDGVWRLVDVNWAARHVTGNDREDWILVDDNGKGAKDVTAELSSLKYAYNEFYFFTDPYQFIYSHIPDTEAWQLLARMVTSSEFGEIAYLKPVFFELGLRIVSDRKCVMHTINGEAELVIGLPEGGEQRSFVYELWQSRDTVKQRRRNVGSSLERYVFMQQIEGQLRCKITLPTAGQFMMKLYAQDPARETNKQYFSYACAYIIHCSSPKPDCVPIPANKRQEWGPGHDLTRLGLTALTHTNGEIEVENGETEIRFKADKKVQILAKLHSNTKDVSELRQHIVHRYEDGEVILNVKLPESGEYALNLYAKDDTVDDRFTNPCSYLLTAKTQAADLIPFPEFPNGEVGAKDEATDIHFEAVSHPTCFIEAPSTGELEMTFKADPCVMTTELILQTPDTHQTVQDHVLHWQSSTGDIALVARFPEPGLYALKLFAKSQDAEGSSMPSVYNYVVKVSSPKEDCLPFPETYSKWNNLTDNKIIEPRNGMLPPHQSVKFVARIPTAVKVATIGKSCWTYLTKEDNDIWSGDVETGDGDNEIKLSALFEEGSNSYSTLLTYIVTDEIAGSDAEDVSDDDDKEDEVSTEPETDEELVNLTQFTEEFHPFTEFPEPKLLKMANDVFTGYNKPVPHNGDGKVCPYPCPSWKQDVFSLKDFTELDAYAVEAPVENSFGDMADLVNYLTHPPSHVPQSAGSGEMSDVSKARVLFRWITAQDLSTLNVSNDASQETPLWYLRNISEDKGNYTTLFAAMCRTAGLDCKQLRGHVKGVNYKLGDEISPDGTSSWAAVLVDGIWRLIDVNWGARHVTGGDSSDWILVDNNGERAKEVAPEPSMMKYAYDEAYFFTDPYQFIYTHIPAEIEAWQLLARSVTLREFGELAYLKPGFFELGLRIVSHRKCTIETEEGEAELVIGLPEGGEQRSFLYKMWQSRGDENETLNVDSEFKRYVFMQQVAGELCCKVYFPKAGTFKLELFAQDSETGGGSYSLACAYIIHCSSPKQDCVPMPANDRKEWGPGNDLAQLGLTALTHKDGLIEVENGQTQIRFKADKDVKILAKLHSNMKDASELSNYVIHHQEDGEVVIDVKLPDSGEYALNLFGKDASAEGSYSGLCSYLLRADTPAFDSTPFPEIANGELGATDKATDLHFEAVSHPTGFIEAPPSGQIDLTFQADSCKMITELILQTPDGPRPVDRHVMYGQRSTGEIVMNVRFPESGLYALKVYAKSRDADGSSMPNVYNYVIKVATPMENCEQFPGVSVAWSGGVDNEIIEPRNGTLVAKQTLEFVAKIPEAVKVATIGNSGWTHLTKEGDGIWKGAVDTGDGGHELTLNAMFEEGSNSYTNLLTYQVVSDNDLEELNERQQKDAIEAEIRREEEEELRKKREDDFKETRQGLLQAIEKQKIDKLRTAIKNVENKRYITRLQRDYNQAKKLLRSLVRIENLRHAVMDLDKKTMAEIRSYAHPPKLVHDVMRASLLLLGDHEGKTRKWEKCQPRCKTIGAKGLPGRVRKFCLDKVNPEIAARSKEILQHFRLDDVRDKSAGAAAFYVWVVGMTEELTTLNGEDKVVTPATLPRQKEILAA